MEAGKLRHRITIQSKTVTYNTYNEPIETWIDAYGLWAEKVSATSREFYLAQKLYTETQEVYRIRFTSVLNSRNRIKVGNKYLSIIGNPIDPDDRHKELLVSCKEVS